MTITSGQRLHVQDMSRTSISTIISTLKGVIHEYELHVIVAKQSNLESCASDVLRWRPLHTDTCLLRQWLTVAAAAVKKNMQFCSVHWLCCSKLMTKKRMKSWRNEKFPEGLRGASSSTYFVLWWRTLKWRSPGPEDLQTLSGWIHSNFNIFFAVNRPQSHSHARRNTTCWAPCCNSSLFSDKYIT